MKSSQVPEGGGGLISFEFRSSSYIKAFGANAKEIGSFGPLLDALIDSKGLTGLDAYSKS